MVERPADVLTMDGRPVKQSMFMRIDGAIRRMPGLGILIVLFLAGDMYAQRSYFGLAAITIGVAGVLIQEFASKE